MDLGRNPVVIVAHPDDETLWCGGLIIRLAQAGAKVEVIACSIPQAGAFRAWHLYEACARLGAAAGFVLPFVERKRSPLVGLNEINLSSYSGIITHGPDGEYGHPHHKQVHAHLSSREVHLPRAFISYSGPCTHELTLTDDERARKLIALKAYRTMDTIRDKSGNVAGIEKWRHLLQRYGDEILSTERYNYAP